VVPREALVWEDGAPIVYRMIPEEADLDADSDAKGKPEMPGWLARWVADPEPEADAEADGLPRHEADRAPVRVGLVHGDVAEILEGVDVGDVVVVVGQSNLKDGALVRTPEMQAEAERRAAAKGEAGDKG